MPVRDLISVALALPTVRARLEAAAARTLNELDLERLVVLAFLHDPGKCGAGFYARGLAEGVEQDWQRANQAWSDRDQRGHVAAVAPLFQGDDTYLPHKQALGVDAVLDWAGKLPSAQGDFFDLWLASLSHHGVPLTKKTLQQKAHKAWPTWTAPIAGYEPVAGLRQLGDAARAIFPDAFVSTAVFRSCKTPLAHAVAGLVSLADWIGSNTDDGFFPYTLGPQTTARWKTSHSRATAVLQAMGIDLDSARRDLVARAPTFEHIFDGHAPRDTQLQAAARTADPVLVLEAETGSGKTEAALWRAKVQLASNRFASTCRAP